MGRRSILYVQIFGEHGSRGSMLGLRYTSLLEEPYDMNYRDVWRRTVEIANEFLARW